MEILRDSRMHHDDNDDKDEVPCSYHLWNCLHGHAKRLILIVCQYATGEGTV